MKIVVAFILSLLVLPLMAEPNKKEPRFFLIPKKSDYETKSFSKVKLYKDPSKDSLVIAELELQWHSPSSSENMKSLYEGKDVYSYITVTSSVKKGDFYSVYYKGEYLWVNVEDFAYALTWKEYFKRFEDFINFGFDKKMPIYEKINGKELPWSTVSQYKRGKDGRRRDLRNGINIPLVEVKLIDDHVWLGFMLGKGGPDESRIVLDKPIPIWIRAYDDNGKVNRWYYGSKRYFPLKKPDESF